jgi:small subunit ribosomal protein S6
VTVYEASLIFKPILDLDSPEGGILRKVEDLIANLSGKISRVEKVGRKRLAFEMNKFKDGYIINMLIELEPQQIVPFRKACKINEDILRLTLLRMDEIKVRVSADTNTTVASQNAPPVREVRINMPRRGFNNDGPAQAAPNADSDEAPRQAPQRA